MVDAHRTDPTHPMHRMTQDQRLAITKLAYGGGGEETRSWGPETAFRATKPSTPDDGFPVLRDDEINPAFEGARVEPLHRSLAAEGLAEHFGPLQAVIARTQHEPALSDAERDRVLRQRWGRDFTANVDAVDAAEAFFRERGHGAEVDAFANAGMLNKLDFVDRLAAFGRALLDPTTERGWRRRSARKEK